jgi:histidinol dehydrogenase
MSVAKWWWGFWLLLVKTMKSFIWKNLSAAERKAALARPENRRDARVVDTVRMIFDDVAARGFAAVSDWSVKLDGHAPRLV